MSSDKLRRSCFRSEVRVTPDRAWAWITSLDGIASELRPWLAMSAPRGIRRLQDVDWAPGKPLFRSRLSLFGLLPVGRSDLTLLALDPGRGFVEQSPMSFMRVWRHERRIEPGPSGCIIEDRLAFAPRCAGPLVHRCIDALFAHRHAVLRRRLGAG